MILSIETSTPSCSIALHDKGRLLAGQSYHVTRSHSSLLPGIIHQLLENVSISKRDLQAISVSGGPGSYTGLRIGITTAKALAYGLQIPLIGIPTLEIILERGLEAVETETYIMPMIDARRMEVYMLVADERGKILQPTHARILQTDSLSDYSDKPVWLCGDGAAKCKDLFSGDQRIVLKSDWFPDASFMGKLGYQKFLKEDFEHLGSFEPDYLKQYQTKKPKSRLIT